MCTHMFIAAAFTKAKTGKQPICPSTDEWIKRMSYTHTHTHTQEYYSATKINGIMSFAAAWMQPKSLILTDLSHKEKDI